MLLKSSLVAFVVGQIADLASAVSLNERRYGGPGPYGGPPYGSSPYGYSRNNVAAFFNDHGHSGAEPAQLTSADIAKFATIPWTEAAQARTAHAVLASLAFIIFFPMGAISVRILPGNLALMLHGLFQLFAYTLYIVATGLGIWIAVTVKFSDFDLLKVYHPVIGLVLFCLLFFQPIGGIMHHLGYKRHRQRTIVSHGHIWLGRILITLGMINGGLGLLLSNNASRGECIAYGVIAGLVWLLWVSLAAFGERRRSQARGPVPVAASKPANGVGNGNEPSIRVAGVDEKAGPNYA